MHGMHATMTSKQLNKIAEVFDPENFEIRTTSIEMPPQITFNWKPVSKQGVGVYFPHDEFLENLEDYRYNKTWSSVSNSSLSKTFALDSLQNLKFRTSVSSLQRSFSLKFILGQKKILGLKKFWFPEKCLA